MRTASETAMKRSVWSQTTPKRSRPVWCRIQKSSSWTCVSTGVVVRGAARPGCRRLRRCWRRRARTRRPPRDRASAWSRAAARVGSASRPSTVVGGQRREIEPRDRRRRRAPSRSRGRDAAASHRHRCSSTIGAPVRVALWLMKRTGFMRPVCRSATAVPGRRRLRRPQVAGNSWNFGNLALWREAAPTARR